MRAAQVSAPRVVCQILLMKLLQRAATGSRGFDEPGPRDEVLIDGLTASAYTVPTDRPEEDGTLAWDRTTLLVVAVRGGGLESLGYGYGSPAAARVIATELAEELRDRSALDIPAISDALSRRLRNVGRSGIGSTAIAALDVALWDLKARLLGVSLLDLLGAARDSVPAYGSGGFTSYTEQQLRDQLAGWAARGLAMVKMKIGRRPSEDPERVAAARDAIGDRVELFVDANGAYDRAQALGTAAWLVDEGVTWFEEPVSSDKVTELALLRGQLPMGMALAAGEYCWTPIDAARLLAAGAVDVLQVDATRCLGVTGFMDAASLCVARSMPLSSHTAPTLHATLCCAAQQARHVEYFHDHVRIEQMLFDGAPAVVDGQLRPDRSRPGLGLDLRTADAEPYLAWRGEWQA